jgi:tRNA-splicing ligase RtcB
MVTLERLDDSRWLIPRSGDMLTDGLVFADDRLMETLRHDKALEQVANVACLPGIVGKSLAMPDIHWGYGFPIGGVAAFDVEDGVISPGGVGYDINCGVRLLRSDLTEAEVRSRLDTLMDRLFRDLPSGVGSRRTDFVLKPADLRGVLAEGAGWVVARGLGNEDDLEAIESRGRLPGADPEALSERARKRGRDQLGTLGSGNHFAEIQVVEEVHDPDTASAFGLEPGSVAFMIHCGSRGLGYQVCDDSLETMLDAAAKYGIKLPDRQLCCAPIPSPEGQWYLGGMNAAANFAFGNRQMLTARAREVFGRVFGESVAAGMRTVYDVCHNIAKFEEHTFEGERREVCVHRKGATRAFPAGHEELPPRYRATGQPVLVPGDMGRYSFVAVATEAGFDEALGSSCHGAGRRMSRTKARKSMHGRNIKQEFHRRGIEIRSAKDRTVAEEVPEAYKDVEDVVRVVASAGIGRPVVKLRPIGVVKG